jgi:hypothetical protein
MDSCDQELLNEQLQRLQLPLRRDGVMILTIVGAFVAGMAAGGLLFARGSGAQTASSDGKTALAFFLNGTPTIAR